MFLTRLSVALRRQDWPTVTVEFLLVVLGVLLALQLDNWNEQRKDRALFQDYLIQLQADLRDDINQAERRIEASRLLDDRAAYLISVIEAKATPPIDHNRLVSSVLTAGYAYLDLVNRQTYDELISTGNLRLFPNTELKREVVSYNDPVWKFWPGFGEERNKGKAEPRTGRGYSLPRLCSAV